MEAWQGVWSTEEERTNPSTARNTCDRDHVTSHDRHMTRLKISLLEVLEGVEGSHDASPLAGRGCDLLAEGDQVLTQTVHLGDGERDATTMVGHLPAERERVAPITGTKLLYIINKLIAIFIIR